MSRGTRDVAALLGLVALLAGGYYAYRRWRILEQKRADESELMIESYDAYTQGNLKPNGHHRKRRRWFHTEPVS